MKRRDAILGALVLIAQQKSIPRGGILSARSRQAAVTIPQSLLMRANEVIH
jgi:hypothetical protein